MSYLNLKRRFSFLFLFVFLLSNSIGLLASDIEIKDAATNNVVFDAMTNTFKPTGAGAILNYGEFLTQLNAGDVTIITDGIGNILFNESGSGDPADEIATFGFSLTTERTLTLEAEGDIDISGVGILPDTATNTSFLNIVIKSTANGDFDLGGRGINSSGGDLSVTGVNEIKIEAFLDLDEGDLDLMGNSLIAQAGVIIVGNATLEITESADFAGFEVRYSKDLDIKADEFLFTSGTIRDIDADTAANNKVTIEADSIDFSNFRFLNSEIVDIIGRTLTAVQSSFIEHYGSVNINLTESLSWTQGQIDLLTLKETADITMAAPTICLTEYQIDNRNPGHETSVNFSGDNGYFLLGNIQLDTAANQVVIGYDFTSDLHFNQWRVWCEGPGDQINVKAGGILNLSGQDFEDKFDCGGGGSFEGSILYIKAQSILAWDYRFESSMGQADVSIKADEQIDLVKSTVEVADDTDFGSTIEFILEAPILNILNTLIALSGDYPTHFEINASDSLNLFEQPLDCDELILDSLGNTIKAEADELDMAIIAGNFTATNLDVQHNSEVSGDLDIQVNNHFKIADCTIQKRGNGSGDFNLEVGDSLIIFQASLLHNSEEGDFNICTGSITNPTTFTNPPVSSGSLGGSIESNVAAGNMSLKVSDKIKLTNGSISLKTVDPSNTLEISALAILLEQSCIFTNGTDELLKVQAGYLDLFKADINTQDGTADLQISGDSLLIKEARFQTNAGDISLNFLNNISFIDAHAKSNGGDLSFTSQAGSIAVVNGDDLSTSPLGFDGLFSGSDVIDGGAITLQACTAININADLNTGTGSGGAFSEDGMPITTIAARRLLGAGDINLSITCTNLEASITDPCNCENDLNLFDTDNNITFYHEIVEVSGNLGDTWTLATLNAGAVYDNTGTEIMDLSLLSATLAPGDTTYVFEFWHAPTIGYDAVFEATAGPSNGLRLPIANSCSADCQRIAENLPAARGWQLWLLGLLLIGVVTLSILRFKKLG